MKTFQRLFFFNFLDCHLTFEDFFFQTWSQKAFRGTVKWKYICLSLRIWIPTADPE